MATYSLLSPQEISSRVAALREAGFPQTGVERLALDLANFCCGPAAEQALPTLLQVLEPGAVSRLVAEHVAPDLAFAANRDFCGSASAVLPQKLWDKHRVKVVRGSDLTVTLPDNMELGQLIMPVDDDDDGVRLCRLALLAVWILEMRSRPEPTPAY